MTTERCPHRYSRHGRVVQCELPPHATGGCEVTDPGKQRGRPKIPSVVLDYPAPIRPLIIVGRKGAPGLLTPYTDKLQALAYAAGAAAYAMGPALDRLAKDMGEPPRAKHESDGDLSTRLMQPLTTK